MYNLKSGEYSITLSPKLIDIMPPDLNVYFINNGSNIGSTSSPTFSKSKGYPS